jgi:hypothetical protein
VSLCGRFRRSPRGPIYFSNGATVAICPKSVRTYQGVDIVVVREIPLGFQERPVTVTYFENIINTSCRTQYELYIADNEYENGNKWSWRKKTYLQLQES